MQKNIAVRNQISTVRNKCTKTVKLYECICCDFKCSQQSNYYNHLLTPSHKNQSLVQTIFEPNTKLFICKICDFKCSKYSNYTSHILTNKHKNNEKNADNIDQTATHNCEKCDKTFLSKSGLWYHSKKCAKTKEIQLNEFEKPDHKCKNCNHGYTNKCFHPISFG